MKTKETIQKMAVFFAAIGKIGNEQTQKMGEVV